jgi:hypothetical protein
VITKRSAWHSDEEQAVVRDLLKQQSADLKSCLTAFKNWLYSMPARASNLDVWAGRNRNLHNEVNDLLAICKKLRFQESAINPSDPRLVQLSDGFPALEKTVNEFRRTLAKSCRMGKMEPVILLQHELNVNQSLKKMQETRKTIHKWSQWHTKHATILYAEERDYIPKDFAEVFGITEKAVRNHLHVWAGKRNNLSEVQPSTGQHWRLSKEWAKDFDRYLRRVTNS